MSNIDFQNGMLVGIVIGESKPTRGQADPFLHVKLDGKILTEPDFFALMSTNVILSPFNITNIQLVSNLSVVEDQ